MTLLLMIAVIALAAWLHDTRKRLVVLEEQLRAPAMPLYRETASDEPIWPEAFAFTDTAEALASYPAKEPAPLDEMPAPFVETHARPLPEPEPEPIQPPSRPGFEDLFGRKLPIWAGGFTLLIAAALLVRYSIDAGLLSPMVRITMAMLLGLSLIGGADITHRKPALVPDIRIPQALAGAGIGSLYAATLAAANLYGLIGPATAFAMLAAITGAAMGLALRFGAPSALLGLVGGLATPALVQSQAPNPPLLAAYIALVVGALTLLSRRQQWAWLGISALVGGTGWSALMIAMGTLDSLSMVCIGALILLLGLGLPTLAATARNAALLRGGAALIGALQLAALVATGHFAPLTWGLYGLLSVGFVWLTTRLPALRPLLILPLLTALTLLAMWPQPGAMLFTLVLAGVVAIYGGSALWHLRHRAGMPEAVSLATIALAGHTVSCWQFDPAHAALLALGFAILPALGASLTWIGAREPHDAPFALQAFASAVLIAIAALTALPEWSAPIALAGVAAGVLALASRAQNRWLSHGALLGLASSMVALALTGSAMVEFQRLVGDSAQVFTGVALLRWGCVMALAIASACMLAGTRRGIATQALAAALAYGMMAQVLTASWLGAACALGLACLAEGMRRRPAVDTLAAMGVFGVLAGLWAIQPCGLWLSAGLTSLIGTPVLINALPTPGLAIRQLLLPALLAGFALWRHPEGRFSKAPWASAIGVLTLVGFHILYKQLFALHDLDAFISLGMAERIIWQALLIGTGTALWKSGRSAIFGMGLIGAGLLHALVYTVVLHNPLWAQQAVGPWPLINLLLPAYAVIFAALTLLSRIVPPIARLVDLARIVLIPIFAWSVLRQMFTGSVIAGHPVGPAESIGLSLLAVGLAVGYLVWGIRTASRDWRIASLVLMLAAVGKVFLLDTSGLAGLLRIGSFLALGFSLMGIGWLYSRYLRPEEAGN